MKKYILLTDSTCDLPDDVIRENGIDLLYFKIALDGVGYTEKVDFSPSQFCEMMRNAHGLPTTSQITQFEFFNRFEEYASQGIEEVLYASISARGSSTYASAVAAAKQFSEKHPESGMSIHIVDSRAYSYAQGIPVLDAARMLDRGTGMKETVAFLNDRYSRMEILLTVYSMKVIRKSGRVNAAAALAGDALGIHPIFTLNDGVSHVVKKARGDRKTVESMAEIVKNRMVSGTPYYIGVSDREKYEAEYTDTFGEWLGYPCKAVFELGSSVLANTGPDAVGIVFEGVPRD